MRVTECERECVAECERECVAEAQVIAVTACQNEDVSAGVRVCECHLGR